LLLTDLLTPERIKIPLEARTKDELLAELVDVITRTNRVHDPDEVLRAVRDREAVLSTGIGNGVARMVIARWVGRLPGWQGMLFSIY
jgi:fructose PTS system EIIBC or EIIC component